MLSHKNWLINVAVAVLEKDSFNRVAADAKLTRGRRLKIYSSQRGVFPSGGPHVGGGGSGGDPGLETSGKSARSLGFSTCYPCNFSRPELQAKLYIPAAYGCPNHLLTNHLSVFYPPRYKKRIAARSGGRRGREWIKARR